MSTNKILVYGPSLGPSTNEADAATTLGFSVTVADAATWSSFTTADFEQFDAIVIGDARCVTGTILLAVAEENRKTWSPAVTGSIYIQGTDPTFHFNAGISAALQLIKNGISFAASGSGTGLYVSLGCYYASSSPNTSVTLLDQFGTFTVQGNNQDNVHILAPSHPAMAGLTDADLSNWHQSIHEAFNSFTASFIPLAEDASNTLPYIIATGTAPVVTAPGVTAPVVTVPGVTVPGVTVPAPPPIVGY